jgi:putative restriction endonuclease
MLMGPSFTEGDAWDGPVFKYLTKNDSGERTGHQAGFVIPKAIAVIFPAREVRFTALLLIDGRPIGIARPRFQIQTWGNTRSGERRVTDLGEWDRQSCAGDLVLIERSNKSDLLYRISLVTRNSPEHAEIQRITSSSWGYLVAKGSVVSYEAIDNAKTALTEKAVSDFQMFSESRSMVSSNRLARDRAFVQIILRNYEKCAVCGGGLRLDSDVHELEAAHIVSVSARGTDDPRNGLGLCRAHHWAFDRGLIGISGNGTVMVATVGHKSVGLKSLLPLEGRDLIAPANAGFAPHPVALEWHRSEVFGRLGNPS